MAGFWQPFMGCAQDGNRQAHRCALSNAQLSELAAALNLPEGSYRLAKKA